MNNVNRASAYAPRYAIIEKILRERIMSDYYCASGFLPQERELAQEFNVSRNTLRNALQLLADQQLITKIQGRGTQVHRPVEEPGQYIVLHFGSDNLSSYVISVLHEVDRQVSNLSSCIIYSRLDKTAKQSEFTKLKQRFDRLKNLRGMLLVGNFTRDVLKRLQDTLTVPMVLVGDFWQETERSEELIVSQIVGDDYGKMYKATSYLLQKGATRIAAIGQPRSLIWGNAYYNGYCDALNENGIDCLSGYYEAIDDYNNPRDIFQQDLGNYLQNLFKSELPPDGLIFPSEYYGTVKWFAEQNSISIPGDLLLVGRSVEYIPQEFPCVVTKPAEMIREAFDLLQQEEQNRGRVRQRRVVQSSWLDAVQNN